MACYGGLEGILTGLTKSTDHPSSWNKKPQNIGCLGPPGFCRPVAPETTEA